MHVFDDNYCFMGKNSVYKITTILQVCAKPDDSSYPSMI